MQRNKYFIQIPKKVKQRNILYWKNIYMHNIFNLFLSFCLIKCLKITRMVQPLWIYKNYPFTWALLSKVDFGISAGGNMKFLAASFSTSTTLKVPNTLLYLGRYSSCSTERDRMHGPCWLNSMKKSCNI